ncbi:MAG: hypothetical protein ACPGFB_04025 [Verrucomicrobiales bacterium]
MIRRFILSLLLVACVVSFTSCGLVAHQVHRATSLITAPLR